VSHATANARRREQARPAPARRRKSSRGPSRAQIRRRRLVLILAVLVGASAAALLGARGTVEDAVREFTLPLRHEDIIRQQSEKKNLDPALVAAVIYQESKFEDRTSHAGAKGLMQILPSTAHYIARKSGGTQFVAGDLATPQINISYGAWYLRYLMDKYDENERLALAAYNAGETNVDKWVRERGGPDGFSASDIPFPETRGYVTSVEQHKKAYRKKYSRELGLD
jgi:soluble lytic murein transglycosylase